MKFLQFSDTDQFVTPEYRISRSASGLFLGGSYSTEEYTYHHKIPVIIVENVQVKQKCTHSTRVLLYYSTVGGRSAQKKKSN